MDRYIWIDALCINQEDIQERNHQVELMGRIYSQAEQVIVWLGSSAAISDLAMQMINKVHELHRARNTVKDNSHSAGDLTHSYKDYLDDIRRWIKYGDPTYSIEFWDPFQHQKYQEPCWRALLQLLKRSYWRRMWIVQEIHLARRSLFYCGDHVVSDIALKDVCDLISTLSETEFRMNFDIWGGTSIKHFWELKKTFAVNLHQRGNSLPARPKLRLKTWLFDCMRLGCTSSEPRDIVYALIGISEDCQEGELVPDYRKSVLDVCYDAMIVCTRQPLIPEINDHWLACKLALCLDLNLEPDEMAWPLISEDTLIPSCH